MKRAIAILVSLLLILPTGLTACGGGTATNEGSSTATLEQATNSAAAEVAEEQAIPISIMLPGKPEITAENDRVFAELEKRTNTKLTINSPGWDVYNDKVNLAVSSGELPDIICCIDNNSRTLLDGWIQNGTIIPFSDEMLAAAPDIMKEYEQTAYYNELTVDGKIFFQPIWWNAAPYPNRGLFHARKDLLDEQGIDVTKLDTLEDVYNAMKQLKSKGTYGLGCIK